jgi:glycerophosphoryl diester phosphodiesterase
MAVAPENTLASFRRAATDGADWIEFDVRLSTDHVPVIFHDDTLERTSSGTGPSSALDLEALKALDAGQWFAPKFQGETIPTLHETITLCQDLGLGMNIEIKPNPGEEAETAISALAMVEAMLGDSQDATAGSVVFSSFKLESLETLRDTGPHWPRGLLISKWRDDWRDLAQGLGCISLHPRDDLLESREIVETIKAENLLIFPYTINDPARAGALLDWGVDAVITDDPGRLKRDIS